MLIVFKWVVSDAMPVMFEGFCFYRQNFKTKHMTICGKNCVNLPKRVPVIFYPKRNIIQIELWTIIQFGIIKMTIMQFQLYVDK